MKYLNLLLFLTTTIKTIPPKEMPKIYQRAYMQPIYQTTKQFYNNPTTPNKIAILQNQLKQEIENQSNADNRSHEEEVIQKTQQNPLLDFLIRYNNFLEQINEDSFILYITRSLPPHFCKI